MDSKSIKIKHNCLYVNQVLFSEVEGLSFVVKNALPQAADKVEGLPCVEENASSQEDDTPTGDESAPPVTPVPASSTVTVSAPAATVA